MFANEWIEKPLTDEEKKRVEYILVNTVTGEEVTDVYGNENGVVKKLNVTEALAKFNDTFQINLNNYTSKVKLKNKKISNKGNRWQQEKEYKYFTINIVNNSPEKLIVTINDMEQFVVEAKSSFNKVYENVNSGVQYIANFSSPSGELDGKVSVTISDLNPFIYDNDYKINRNIINNLIQKTVSIINNNKG